MDGKFVSYIRVSTARQGASGLGLEGQKEAVRQFLNGGHWKLVGEFVEVESGKCNTRPQLAEALALCRMTNATLLVAKIDRLSRNLSFLCRLRDAGVKFSACDNPQANDLTVNILASVADAEGKAISERTRTALAASTKKLGGYRANAPKVDGSLGRAAQQRRAAEFAARLRPMVTELQSQGASLRQIAAILTERSIETSRGGAWTAAAVSKVMQAA